jgi:hypothetical protein
MFSSISSLAIQVGSAIKKELWDKVKNNFDDHESRLNSVETVQKKIPVMKFDFRNATSLSTATGVYYWESDDDFTITDAFLRIYEGGSLTGTLQIDIKKSTTDLNGTSFFTIFTTRPSINLATDPDYSASTNQVFDPGQINVAKGDFLRLDITQFPTNGVLGKFLLTVYGE